ncbi:MAG: heparinase II/III family protein [Candidatus Eremiobacteraeota bacterium]|nr:heparinase II/III family protein [Candidatus Eremiobacteraeota bacterium]
MLKAWEKIARSLLSEQTAPEKLYSKRSRARGIPAFSDREFFWFLDFTNPDLAEIMKKVDARDYKGGAMALLDHFRKRTLPMFMPNYTAREYIVQQVKEYFPNSCDAIIKRARRATHNIFNLPIIGEVNFGSAPDWFTDFSGGTRVYGHVGELRDIFVGEEYVAALPTWELNKLLHLSDLGRAYWLTGEEDFTHAFISQVNDWIERNPPNMGINWLENNFLAQRAISYLLALGYFLPSPQLDPFFFLKFMKNIIMHGACLYERACKKKIPDSPAPYAALYMIGFLFPEFHHSSRWLKFGESKLTEFCQRITGDKPDTARASFMKARWEFGICLYPMLIAALHGEVLTEEFEECLERGLNFLLYALEPNGTLPMLGESWTGGVFTSSGHPDMETHIILSMGALIFDSPHMKKTGIKGSSELVWLCGQKDWEKYLSLDETEPSKLTLSAPVEGIFISRTSWKQTASRIIFRNLPGKLTRKLNHSDFLQILLTINGEPVLIDSGCSVGLPHRKEYLSSLQAHNVLFVPHINQNPDTIFHLSSGGKTNPPLMKSRPEMDFIVGGFITTDENGRQLSFRRRIIFDKKLQWLVLEDRLDGIGTHPVELYFHLHPMVEIVVRGDLGCLIRTGKVQARLTCYFPGDFNCEIVKGENSPPGGWYVDGTGKIFPCPQLRYFTKENLPLNIYTWIGWSPTDFKTPSIDELTHMFFLAERLG